MKPLYLSIISILVGIGVGYLLCELRYLPNTPAIFKKRRKEARRKG